MTSRGRRSYQAGFWNPPNLHQAGFCCPAPPSSSGHLVQLCLLEQGHQVDNYRPNWGRGWNFFLLPSSFPYQTITKYGERMNRNFLMLSFLVIMLSACMVPPTGSQPAPVASEAPALPPTAVAIEPTEVSTEMIPS